MNKRMKNILVAMVSSVTLMMGILAYADDQSVVNVNSGAAQSCQSKTMHWGHWCHRNHRFNLGLNRNKNLTQNDAKIIIEAALLMQGRKDLHVGEIKNTQGKHGHAKYLIQIDDSANQIISTVVVNSMTGHFHPKRHLDAQKVS